MDAPQGAACPKCGYVRKPGDTGPGWQCPACGIAIEKYQAMHTGVAPLVPGTVVQPQAGVGANEPLANRFATAAPDLCTAALFLWCWMSPHGWRAPLVQPLGVVLLMQFFVMHSNIFLMSTVGQEKAGYGARIVAAGIILAFYIPVAGAFAFFYGGWWPFWTFVALLGGRVVASLGASGSDEYQAKRLRFHWVNDAAFYILTVFVAVLAPMPRLGLHDYGRLGSWTIPAESVMAWGVLSFGASGVLKLIEQRSWIEEWDETPQSSSDG